MATRLAVVGVAAGGDPAHHLAVVPHRLVADHVEGVGAGAHVHRMGVSAMRPGTGIRPASSRSSPSLAPGPSTRNLAKPVVSIRPTVARTARVSARTRSQALERPKVTSSTGSNPGAWNHSADSSPKASPNTALASASRS